MDTATKPYYITGRSDTGVVAPRLSIEELQLKDEQFTLFILSFLIIQDRKDSIAPGPLPIPPGTGVAAATFFNIAAIHGKPYGRWSGDHKEYRSDFDANDPKDTEPVPSRFGGYCNHGSVLFPTWHRPYVLLIEQAIGEQATALALAFDKLEQEEDPNCTKWQEAAKQLRFPYWDWASPRVEQEGMPSVLYAETLSLKVPKSDENLSVANPLALFPIQVIPDDFTVEVDDENVKSYFTTWKTTLRHPRSDKNAENSRIDELQKTLKALSRDLRSKVAALFTYGEGEDPNRVWDEFSNHSPVTIKKESEAYRGSLEGVHDTVHDIIGGLGHMGFPDYAGFDPIFYLHHANVDRLYALWEYCYQPENKGDGYWMGSGYKETTKSGTIKVVPWKQPAGTYSAVYNAQLLPDSALAPFRMTNGEYWSSKEARYLTKGATPKYYTYHTLGIKVDEDASKEQRLKARCTVQGYYDYKPEPKYMPGGLFKKIHVQLPENFEVVEGHRQFVVVVDLLEHAYNGPYSFKLYKKGTSVPEVVGGVSVFARPDHSPCAACAGHRADGSTVKGVIFLDEKTVDDLIGDANIETHGITDVAIGIKNLLHAELTNPEGVRLGVVHLPEEDSEGIGAESHLAKDAAPVSVTLLSTAAVRRTDIDGSPITWADWRHHGDVFEGGHRAWKKPANA